MKDTPEILGCYGEGRLFFPHLPVLHLLSTFQLTNIPDIQVRDPATLSKNRS